MKKFINLFFIFTIILLTFSISANADENATRLYSLQKLLSYANVELPTDESEINNILSSFSDVLDVAYADKQILAYAISNGYINGYPDGTIKPYGSITRGEYAVILSRCDEILRNNDIIINHPEMYEDVEYWCSDAVNYCMERCYMIGYGSSFGTNDNLTSEQVDTVVERAMFPGGADSIDTYNALVISRSKGLNLNAVMQSANVEELAASNSDVKPGAYYVYLPSIDGIDESQSEYEGLYLLTQDSSNYMLGLFGRYVDLYGTFDYEQYPDDESILYLMAQMSRVYPLTAERTIESFISILDVNDNPRADMIKEKINNKVKSKAIFVSAHQNTLECILPNRIYDIAKGYEYFIYYECIPEALPEGVETGKWYRRKLKIFIDTAGGTSSSYQEIYTEYSEPELVPDYLLDE